MYRPRRLAPPAPPPKRRLVALWVVAIVVFGALVFRLVSLQVTPSSKLIDYGESQRTRTVPLAANRGAIVDRTGVSVQVEKRLVDSNEIADLRDEFDGTVRSLGLSYEQSEIDRQNNARRSPMLDHAICRPEAEAFACANIGAERWIGINAFDHREPVATDVRQNADRAQ
jgi:cell division protein FtsI/penicillin-binding protein 2